MQLHIRGNTSHVLDVEQCETVAEIKVNITTEMLSLELRLGIVESAWKIIDSYGEIIHFNHFLRYACRREAFKLRFCSTFDEI